MTVYVDDMRAKFGRMIMCHMIADSDEELHAMAARLGLKRAWHQAPPKASHSHYDISLFVRARAVAAGAVEITWRQLAFMRRRERVEGSMGKPEEAEAWWENRTRLTASLKALRARAEPVGPLHAAWDTIFEVEAVLRGKPGQRPLDELLQLCETQEKRHG